MYSAFGFAGQKCSAASRVIVLEEVFEKFESRILEATKSIHLASAENPDAYLGPVVDEEAYELAYQAVVPSTGYFVPPTIFTDVDSKSDLAQKEIFGPVLALIKAKDLDHALEIANSTEYALTGGLFSRSPANIERIRSGKSLYQSRNYWSYGRSSPVWWI